MEINYGSLRAELRSRMIRRRQELSIEEKVNAQTKIMDTLSQLVPIQTAQTIMAFAAIRNEVDVSAFLEVQQQSGKTILLPRVEGNELAAVKWEGWQETTVSSFGIAEPVGSAFPSQEIDVVLVPGLVFDGNGYRLGYGRGFYDRFLSSLRSDTFKCGICYEFQVVDNIYPHERDVPVHWIVTEQSELLIAGEFF
ncbi:5-formyltetrahydrofolate cyclo-ligase [Syntrophomonas zehnderi OL-4]|uniref:5-formyltetrahydrofolate cyclo-ligase n=1 Tax=Syntrophomonas zehnderi OL-4 TaxID=690567 RepID=A0A0E3W3L1_9FIRM|nr:5-formyltetrahydrofolate cyclo-ligase [Syntrophomonas zehnderi]CFX90463.1 5-formyltetrahydrofolate cyclo-ligase [Syntrophomonas zehnderi OL-4]